MLSKALDAELISKNRTIAVTNTEFDISVEWSVVVEESEDHAMVGVSINRIFGNFSYKDSKEAFKRRVEVEFECSDGWKMYPIDKGRLSGWVDTTRGSKVYPDMVQIDFDNKVAKVCF